MRHAHVIVLQLDTHGRVLWISEGAERITGYSAEDLIGRDWFDVLVPRSRYPHVWEQDARRGAGPRVPRTFEHPIVTKSGEERFISWHNRDLLDGGVPAGTISLGIDITDRRLAEEALRESQDRYKTLVEQATDIIYQTDDRGRFTFVNAVVARVLGLTPEECIGRHYLDLVAPEAREETRAFYRAQVAERTAATYLELPVMTKTGGRTWLGQNVHLMLDGDRITGFHAHARDISKPHRAEEALRQSEERFRSLAAASPMGIFHTDPTGRCEYVNAKWQEITGLGFDENVGDGWTLAIHADDRTLVSTWWATCTREGREFSLEFRFQRPDGEIRWVQAQASAIRDKDGVVTGFVGMAEDITDRKRVDGELRAQRDFALQVMNTIAQGLAVTDAQGRFEYVNPALATMLGYPVEKLTYKNTMEIIHEDDRPLLSRERGRRREGEVDTYDVRFKGADGKVIDVLVTAVPRISDGEYKGAIAIITDLTERKQAENDIREANEKLTAWVGQLQQRNREISLLGEMTEYLLGCQHQDEIAKVVALFLPQLFSSLSGALYVLAPTNDLLEAVTSWGPSAPTANVFVPEDCWAVRRARGHSWNSTIAGLPCPHLGPHTPDATICVPLASQGEVLGVLHLSVRGAGQHHATVWGESVEQLAAAVAEQIGLAITNLRLRETLRHQSIRDPLTGLFNRRYMEESLVRELQRASRAGIPVSVIMLDLDHFKRFNDSFGHAAGDALMRALASVLQKGIRAEDIACRYGGEEFALILPGAPVHIAQARAEGIRQAAARLSVEHQGTALGAVTLSLGIAVFPDHGATGEKVLKAADAALYRAKAEGRDRVVTAG
jgi:diguanylate cyclase (GGDEF)-like protein/PAS domain S-box-containing protein